MYRCVFATLAVATLAAPAAAQVQRNFPATALRGTLAIGLPPEVTLNGQAARLAPGARIRGQDNLIVLSASLAGGSMVVNYTLDAAGLIRDVWILTSDEAAKSPWPQTLEQAQTWEFDPIAQTWTKR